MTRESGLDRALSAPLESGQGEAAFEGLRAWESTWPDFEPDETVRIPAARQTAVLEELVSRLADGPPLFHPAYAGQMLKPPHPIAALAYALAMQINPNNHANDAGAATSKMELECVAKLAQLFGFDPFLGHLTSGGTMANLEALWVARQIHPGAAIAFSDQAHYTHARMCEVIGAPSLSIATDSSGCLDPEDLERKLEDHNIGTVVVTAGTTSLGAVDPIPTVLELCRPRGVRIHVDAAFGGFYRLLADIDGGLASGDAASFRAIADCDSVVVDPHKHGLQPYGCGSVLFADPGVGRFYRHDSPYTYFTSAALHLGEISLECSRAGAAAAAFWATLMCFPLLPEDGLGAILEKTRCAATEWAGFIRASSSLRLVVEPALDIVNFYALTPDRRTSSISALTERVFSDGMSDPNDAVYLAKLNVRPEVLASHEDLIWDTPTLTVLRSCLMKPEHLAEVPRLHRRVLELAEARA